VGTFKGVGQICSDRPCCNGNDYKYKPILNDSAPVNISETDKAIDFKCGTQLQTYNTHKVTNIPTEEAWLKCSIYRLSVNALMKMWDIEFIKRWEKLDTVITMVR